MVVDLDGDGDLDVYDHPSTMFGADSLSVDRANDQTPAIVRSRLRGARGSNGGRADGRYDRTRKERDAGIHVAVAVAVKVHDQDHDDDEVKVASYG